MQNNFSKCREWVPRGTSQHKWRWLTTLLLILTLGIGQMWAAEETLTWAFSGINTACTDPSGITKSSTSATSTIQSSMAATFSNVKTKSDASSSGYSSKLQATAGTYLGDKNNKQLLADQYVGASFTIPSGYVFKLKSISFPYCAISTGINARLTISDGETDVTPSDGSASSGGTATISYSDATMAKELSGDVTVKIWFWMPGSTSTGKYAGMGNLEITGDLVASGGDPVPVTGITITPSPAAIKVGKTVTLTPTITPSNATDKAVTWSVTSGSSYASVTDAGVVTGLSEGTAVVTATAHDGSGVTQTVTVNVSACPTSGTLFSMTVTDPDGTVYTDVTDAAPQEIGATYTGGKAYATSTSSSKRSPKITGSEFDFNVGSGGSVAVKVELDCPLAEGDIITFTSTHDKNFYIRKVVGTDLHTTSSLKLEIPSGSALIGEEVFYIMRTNSACSFSEINIIRPIYRTITLEYADGVTPDGSLKVIDGEKAAKPADPTWAHHRFDGWYNGASPYDWTATVSGDLTLTAHWTQLYTVTYAKGDEGATGDAPTQADKAATETFKVAANTFELAGKVFDHWNDGTADYNPEDTYTVGTSNVTLTAVWRTPSTMYAITKGDHDHGDFTISPAEQEEGGTVTLEATPAEDYLFDAWEVVKTEDASATGITVDANGQFEMPAYGVTVNATFVADTRAKVLYISTASTENDKVYEALKDIYNVKVVSDPASTIDQSAFALVVLHESVGGGNYNATAIAAAKTGDVPVLNTKAYFYNGSRWGWGEPNSGKKTAGVHVNRTYCNITDHPLFAGLTPDANDSIIILSAINTDNKPIQPVGSFTSGKEGYTLANVPDGCAIHELTPAQRGASAGKYLLISLYSKDFANLNADGQKLFQNAAAYLIGSTAWTPVEGLGTTTIDATGNPFSEGATMTLTASATGATASTTYAWYKGDTWAEAEAAGTIQAAKTAENSGHIYTKTAASEDAGTYWCVMVKSTGCEATASVEVSVLSCTKPGTPANLVASDLAYTTANLSWDAAANANGYKISIIKKDDESIIVDWTDNATTSYAATGLTQGTEYTLKVKAVGATGYCEFGLEATVDFTTTAPSVADLVTIDADYTFEPSVNIPAGTLSADSKFFAAGSGDCDMSDGKMRVKENRALAFKVADKAKIKVTFATKSGRQIQLGTAMSEGNYDTYGSSESSPYTFDVVTTGGVVYLTAHNDQLYFSKLEIIYPRTVTYDLNGGTGTQPTESAHYEGDKFTVHNGETDITAPSGQEFDKWKDQDNADVAGGAEYTMPAKAVTLTAQWRAETVKYTVTYDLDDYTAGVAPTETDKAAGDVFAIKAAPSRDGYAFMGWLCNIDAQTYQATDDYTMTAAATTFTAVWKQEFQVTYNLQGHGDPIAPQIVVDGAKATKPADPVADGFDFGGWFTDEECTAGNEFDFNTSITAATPLYAKWTTDPCPDKKSIVKAVMATNTTATVTGYNSNEYAGGYIVNNLADDASNTNMHDFGEGEVKGFKLKGSNSAIFATLSKGSFVAGDQVVFAVTKNAGDNKLAIYAAKDKDHVLKLVELDVDAAGIYTYRLTQDNIDAIEAAGSDYLSIGTFRGDYNPYIYSVELKGCRSWAIFHTLTFKNFDGTVTIAAEPLEEGAYASTVAPVAPKIAMKRFKGWSESIGGSTVDLTSYTITEDKTLYAVYEDIVCPTNGTVYKFEIKDELPSENLPTSTDKDMSSYITATGDGYLTYTATANNKATINSDGTIQMKDASAAYLKVELECALAAGDQIRAHITGNPMRVQVGTTYDSNKDIILAKDNYVFVDITSAMVGKQVLYITRSTNGNANIADFEIYRRPELTGATLADLTIRQGQSKTPVMTLEPSADARVTSQVWEIVGTPTNLTGAEIDPATGAITTGTLDDPTSTGSISVKVTLNGSIEATCTATVVGNIAQQDVTKSTVWDWHNTGATANIQLDGNTDPEKNENFVLANVAVNNNDEFESDKLAVEGEHMVRDYDKTNPYFQGQLIQFHTTVAGVVRVKFAHTGNATAEKPARELYINGVATGDTRANATPAWSNYIEVPAGDVSITAHYVNLSPVAAQQYIRVSEIEFLALEDRRADTWVKPGELGTVCLKNDAMVMGANIYALAGLDENGYLAFNQISNGELVAGKPYLFEATRSGDVSFYKTLNAGHADEADVTNGMHGTFSDKTFSPNTAESAGIYYFSGTHIWKVDDFSVDITVPAYRCYVDYVAVQNAGPAQAPAAGCRRVTLGVNGKNTATDLENLVGGEQVQKLLINGQMYILRGEKLFDATGRLVK